MIGFNTAVAGVASLIVVPFVPRLAARYGVLALLLSAVLTVPAVIIGFKLLYGIAWWFPLRFVLSAALGVLFVLSEYWITASSPPRPRDGDLRYGPRRGLHPGAVHPRGRRHQRLAALSRGRRPVLARDPTAAARRKPHAGPRPRQATQRLQPRRRRAGGDARGLRLRGARDRRLRAVADLRARNRPCRAEAALLVSAVALGNVALQIRSGSSRTGWTAGRSCSPRPSLEHRRPPDPCLQGQRNRPRRPALRLGRADRERSTRSASPISARAFPVPTSSAPTPPSCCCTMSASSSGRRSSG